MIRRLIAFTDFNGEAQVEEHFFHMGKSELLNMELGVDGGMEAMLKTLVANENQSGMIGVIKDIIVKSYGVKSPDGKRFEKTDAIRDAFLESPAFDALFMEMITNVEGAIEFMNGILPKDLADASQVRKAVQDAKLPGKTASLAFYDEAQRMSPAAVAEFPNPVDDMKIARDMIASEPRHPAVVPDPNKLDKDSVWPGSSDEDEADERLEQDVASGLRNPRDKDGELLPWALREPTQLEQTRMERSQLMEAFARKSRGWTPPAS
jgi:hypothetical protein